MLEVLFIKVIFIVRRYKYGVDEVTKTLPFDGGVMGGGAVSKSIWSSVNKFYCCGVLYKSNHTH